MQCWQKINEAKTDISYENKMVQIYNVQTIFWVITLFELI